MIMEKASIMNRELNKYDFRVKYKYDFRVKFSIYSISEKNGVTQVRYAHRQDNSKSTNTKRSSDGKYKA